MSLSVCPVCAGTGSMPEGFYRSTTGYWLSNGTATEPCRTCHGGGVVQPINVVHYPVRGQS